MDNLALDLFSGLDLPSPDTRKKISAPLQSTSYERAFRKRAEIEKQTDMYEQPKKALLYMSGVSSVTDMQGCIAANADICVNMVDISVRSTKILIDYLNSDSHAFVFIDSGAFRVHNSTKKGLDFDEVISFYMSITKRVSKTEKLTICAPDVLGDQQASFDLQMQYKEDIEEFIKLGVKVIFPLQRGETSLKDGYDKLCSVFGKEHIVAGIPAAAAAFPIEEVMGFMKTEPEKVHFLGANNNKPIVVKAGIISPNTDISCDSNRLLAYIGKGRPLTELSRDLGKMANEFYKKVIDNNNWRGEVHRPQDLNWVPGDYYNCLDYTEFDAELGILSLEWSDIETLFSNIEHLIIEMGLDARSFVEAIKDVKVLDLVTDFYTDDFAFLVHNAIWDEYSAIVSSKLTPTLASTSARIKAIEVCCENNLFS